jgi:peptidyl-prolyl cis-trans isomerase SurA
MHRRSIAFPHRCQAFVVLSLLAAAHVSAACRSNPSTSPQSVSADTWAVVDGREIKRDQVEQAFRRTRDTSQTLSDEETLALELSLLDELIAQDLLLAKARELKIELPDSELDAAYAEAKKNMTDEAFQQELARRKLSPADMREGLRRQLLSQKVMEREVVSKVDVTDQDVTDYFNANRGQFNIAEESYRIAQIVVTPVREAQVANRRGDDAVTPQAAIAKVRMLAERLKAGTPFSDLAMDYSEDPETAPRGGDLGFVSLSSLKQAPPQLRDAVLNKAPGTVNVVTAGGAHTIVLIVAHEPAGQRDLSMPAVRENITATLRSRREQLLRAAYLTSLRDNAEVVNHLARRLVEGRAKVPSVLPAAPGGK